MDGRRLIWIVSILYVSYCNGLDWPNCIEITDIDFNGNDAIVGYRFSREGCARWCWKVSDCVLWVYESFSNQCHIKLEFGKRNDDERQRNTTELRKTYYGVRDCLPPEKEYWPNCIKNGLKLVFPSTSEKVDRSTNIEDCSWKCFMNDKCQFWIFDDLECRMSEIGGGTVVPSKSSYGSRNCFGRVSVEGSSKTPIDGGWTPWSRLNTPCFNKITGETVTCGKGIRYRYRTCSNPEPRFGGKVCPGLDMEEYPCNTHFCRLQGEWSWSVWSTPTVPCGRGTRKRESICGMTRKRLPSKKSVRKLLWPDCLIHRANDGYILEKFDDVTSLSDCAQSCSFSAKCRFWSFDLYNTTCIFYRNLRLLSIDLDLVVTGPRGCENEDVPPPYCGSVNKEYFGLLEVERSDVKNASSCVEACRNESNCYRWTFKRNKTNFSDTSCELYQSNTSSPEIEVEKSASKFLTVSGNVSCVDPIRSKLATPEEDEEIMYKSICVGELYESIVESVNTWNRTLCPSPCERNGNCPKNARCYDRSTDKDPLVECVCQMGLEMVDGECQSVMKASIFENPEWKLSKDVVNIPIFIGETIVMICIFVSFVVFLSMRIFDPGRFIQANVEVSVFLAFLFMITEDFVDIDRCRSWNMTIHYFWTACFVFLTLEGIHVYSLLSHAVNKWGMLGYLNNFGIGWGTSFIIVVFNVCFEYDNYDCTVPYRHPPFMYGKVTPILLFIIVTLTLFEASGSIHEETMTQLSGTHHNKHYKEAKTMRGTLLVKTAFLVITFLFDDVVVKYRENSTVSIMIAVLNGWTGMIVLYSHSIRNEKVKPSSSKGIKTWRRKLWCLV